MTAVDPTTPLPAPHYSGSSSRGIVLGVASMRHHMTDEGWQLTAGLDHAGYVLCGRGLTADSVDVPYLLALTEPGVVVVQDKREWDGKTAGRGFDDRERFTNYRCLKDRDDLFKLTVLKDAHQKPAYHAESAAEMGVHGWVTYYDPARITSREQAPYLRREHLIRTYHTVDKEAVPDYSPDGRRGCVMSGAVSGAYPLRQKILANTRAIPELTVLRHPGYHRNGPATPSFLQELSRYKVAVCTASRYGYALRKIIEATACGCAVITDLQAEDVLPEIDGNLYRVSPSIHPAHLGGLVANMVRGYDADRQREFADKARAWYDYRESGRRLVKDIEQLRSNYRHVS